MPWQDNSGKNGSGKGPVRGPWGQPPRPPGGGDNGSGRGEPPDLEELLQASRQRFKRAFPPRNGGGGGGGAPHITPQLAGLIAAGVLGLWALSGFYQVNTAERAVVTTFGKYTAVTGPGLHWHMPLPIQNARKEIVTELRETLAPATTAQRGQQSGGLMLTGDKNIVDVGIKVQWRIKPDVTAPEGQLPPVAQFIFTIEDPDNLVRTVSEAAIREVVGRNELDFVQTDGRAVVMDETRQLIQDTLDAQGAGIEIDSVNLEKADPPTPEVNEAFLDVIAAAQDREQYINRAREDANKVVPQARGEAQRMIEEARAYQAQVTAEARGQADRFNAILTEYQKAPEVTRQRMYLETVEGVIGPMDKIIIEEGAGGGVVPYLPLNELNKKGASQ